MRELFLSIIQEQPVGRVYFGGCTKDKDKDKEKEKEKEKEGDSDCIVAAGILGMRDSKAADFYSKEYQISAEIRCFLVLFKGRRQRKKSKELIDAHLSYLKQLTSNKKLEAAGAFATGEGGMQILLCDSLEEAESIVEADPIYKEGYYTTYEITEIIGPRLSSATRERLSG